MQILPDPIKDNLIMMEQEQLDGWWGKFRTILKMEKQKN